jgi:hypothetical protein
MLHCNPCHTPIDTKAKSSISNGHPLANPTEYHSLIVALQSLTLTLPDITYAVQQACLFMHAPATSDHTLVKCILRYIKGTLHFGLQLSQSSSTDLIIFFDAIGLLASIQAVQRLGVVHTLVATWCPGLQKGSTPCPSPVPSSNRGVSSMLSLRVVGFIKCCKS